jgi:cyclic pyranopterin phosphate synthase
VPITIQPRLLRLSVTDRCNFRCRYCLPAEGVTKLPHEALLSIEEMAATVAWLCRHAGIERIKLTGGEPLVRAGLDELIRLLTAIPGVTEVSMISNGSLLVQLAHRLKSAGLSRVSISLDTLDRERFRELTRGGSLEKTLAGISAAAEAGLGPIKLNAVLRRSTWMEDVPTLLDYAANHEYGLRFIELMRTGTERSWCESEFVAAPEVSRWVGERCQLLAVDAPSHAPARVVRVLWRGAAIEVGWITPRSHPFCNRCDRIRMDARGRVFRCLMDADNLDLRALLSKSSDTEADDALSSYLARKTAPEIMDKADPMILIGG